MFSEYVENGFDIFFKTFLPKVRKDFDQSQKNEEESFKKSIFSSKCSSEHKECRFDNLAEKVVPNVTENFCPKSEYVTKTKENWKNLFPQKVSWSYRNRFWQSPRKIFAENQEMFRSKCERKLKKSFSKKIFYQIPKKRIKVPKKCFPATCSSGREEKNLSILKKTFSQMLNKLCSKSEYAPKTIKQFEKVCLFKMVSEQEKKTVLTTFLFLPKVRESVAPNSKKEEFSKKTIFFIQMFVETRSKQFLQVCRIFYYKIWKFFAQCPNFEKKNKKWKMWLFIFLLIK